MDDAKKEKENANYTGRKRFRTIYVTQLNMGLDAGMAHF